MNRLHHHLPLESSLAGLILPSLLYKVKDESRPD